MVVQYVYFYLYDVIASLQRKEMIQLNMKEQELLKKLSGQEENKNKGFINDIHELHNDRLY